MQIKGASLDEAAEAARKIFEQHKAAFAENLKSGAYNPPMTSEQIASASAVVAREAKPNPVPAVTRNGMDVRSAAPDREAGDIGGTNANYQERQENPIVDDEAVWDEKGKASFLRLDQQGQDQGNRHENRVPQKAESLIVETFEGETKEKVTEQVPSDAVSVTYKRLWRAYVVRTR